MYLLSGRQNKLQTYNNYQVGGGWSTPTATYVGWTETAPDGSSLAQTWQGDGVTWEYISHTLSTENVPHSVFIASAYIKTNSSANVRVSIGVTGTSFCGYSLYLNNGVAETDATHNNVLFYGFSDVGNGWYRIWAVTDHLCGGSATGRLFRVYPNAPHAGASANQNVIIWGAQCEETIYRSYPTSLYKTSGTTYNPTGDFDFVEFTQLPSAIEEKTDDAIEELYYVDGSKQRISPYKDTEIRTLVWDKINYITHGDMLYKIRQATLKKTNSIVVFNYGGLFKRRIQQENVKILDFRLTYSEVLKDHAHVEVDYIVVDSLAY